MHFVTHNAGAGGGKVHLRVDVGHAIALHDITEGEV